MGALPRRSGLDQDHVQAQPATGRRVQPRVVGLPDIDQDQGVAPFGAEVGHPELEGAHLVAAEGEAGKVIALQQQARPAERRREPGQRFQGRRRQREAGNARQPANALAELVWAEASCAGNRIHVRASVFDSGGVGDPDRPLPGS